MRKLGIVNISHIFLIFSILFSVTVAVWLYRDSDIEQYREFRKIHKKLLVYEQLDQAEQFRSLTLANIKQDSLHELWTPQVHEETNKSIKIYLFSKLLAGNPDNESNYANIALLIDDVFTKKNLLKEKNVYLKKINAINGVKLDLLNKYNLVAN